jgi:hypothetical protein
MKYFAVQRQTEDGWITVTMVYFDTEPEARLQMEDYQKRLPKERYRIVEIKPIEEAA